MADFKEDKISLMSKILFTCIFILFNTVACLIGNAQTDSSNSSLEINADVYFYFFEDDFMILPVLRADNDKLHFEVRYNYEDTKTVSGWIGYNFSGGKKFEYQVTPMIGGVAGNTNGLAPRMEVTLGFNRFELYTEAEYLFDFESQDNDYFYSWTDLSYSATEWLRFGISGQRMHPIHSDLEFQRGILIGISVKRWEIKDYFFNPGSDSPYYVIGLSYKF